MASNNAFTLQGSTPKINIQGYGMPVDPKTPQAKALSSISSGASLTGNSFGSTNPYNPSGAVLSSKNNPLNLTQNNATQSSTPSIPGQGGGYKPLAQFPTTSGLLPNSAPVKKQTVTNTDGSSHTVEYHAPDVYSGLINSSSVNSNSQIGASGGGYSAEELARFNSGGAGTDPNKKVYKEPQDFQPPQNANSYPGIISNLSTTALGNKTIGDKAAAIAEKYGNNIAEISTRGNNAEAGYLTTGTSPVAEGNAAVIANTAANQIAGQAKAEEAALQGTGQQLTAQGQTQSGLSNAGNLAAPIQVPYSNQVINPATGQPYGLGSASLSDAVNNVVQRLKNGTIGYEDAKAALSGYGQGGINALQEALPANFNIAQSNTLAGQQGTIGPAYEFADKALTNVETLMSQLPSIQNTNIPGVNSLTQGFSTITGLGSEQTRAVTGAVQTLRNAYAALLASARGGTPTDYSGQAQAEIPDKPTANDIAAIRKNFETLGAARKDIYGNPGTSGVSGSSNPTGSTVQTSAGTIATNW